MNHGEHQPATPARAGTPAGHGRRMSHRWMMFACCVPMLAIVIALVATGAVGVAFLVIALLCVAMMPLMHGGMSHEDAHADRERPPQTEPAARSAVATLPPPGAGDLGGRGAGDGPEVRRRRSG